MHELRSQHFWFRNPTSAPRKRIFQLQLRKASKKNLMTPNPQCTNEIEGVRIYLVAVNYQYGR